MSLSTFFGEHDVEFEFHLENVLNNIFCGIRKRFLKLFDV